MIAADVPQIPRDELVARLDDPSLTILNVLPWASWSAKRIPRSRSLPLGEIEERAPVDLPDKDAEIAIYCASET